MGPTSRLPNKDNMNEDVAPTVEHWTPNPRVVGSNPIVLTFLLSIIFESRKPKRD